MTKEDLLEAVSRVPNTHIDEVHQYITKLCDEFERKEKRRIAGQRWLDEINAHIASLTPEERAEHIKKVEAIIEANAEFTRQLDNCLKIDPEIMRRRITI